MAKKVNNLQQQLKFHCSACQTLYQLLEIILVIMITCTDDCLTKWQEFLFNHYQEKILFQLSQERSDQSDQEKTTDLAEQLGIKVKKK